jgi:hypothetical protein
MRAAPARAVTDKKAPLRGVLTVRAAVFTKGMPPKRKAPAQPAPPETSDAAAAPVRTKDNAHLYCKELYGMNAKLDFRSRILIGCHVLDNIPASVVRLAFAKAHI